MNFNNLTETKKGITVSLDTNTVIYPSGRIEPINEENMDEVIMCLEHNLNRLNTSSKKLRAKLKIEERIEIPIKDGIRYLEPLNDMQRKAFEKKLKENRKNTNIILKYIKSLNA
mgnify:CR=1 FL=1